MSRIRLWAAFCLLLLLSFLFHQVHSWNMEQVSIHFNHTTYTVIELTLVLLFAGTVLWAVGSTKDTHLHPGEYAVLTVVGLVLLFSMGSRILGIQLPVLLGTRGLLGSRPLPFSYPGLASAVWLLCGVSGLAGLVKAHRPGQAREA